MIFYENTDLTRNNKIRVHFGPTTMGAPTVQGNSTAFLTGDTTNRIIRFNPGNPMTFDRSSVGLTNNQNITSTNFNTQYRVVNRFIDFSY